MTFPILEGYADASGNENTAVDQFVIVGGGLSTPEKWASLDMAWESLLKNEGFHADLQTGRYVYHTTDVWAGRGVHIPLALSNRDKQRIHRSLIEIIREHVIYRFGFAVHLADLRRMEKDFPHAIEFAFGKAGSLLSKLIFRRNQVWAENNNYDPHISYVFDRGDEFWGDLFASYRFARKQLVPEEMLLGDLTCGNKANSSPLQAADLIAWETRQYFQQTKSIHKVTALASGLRRRYEMSRLMEPKSAATFGLDHRTSLMNLLQYLFRPVVEAVAEENNLPADKLIGEGLPFSDFDEFAQHLLKSAKEDSVAETKAKQELARQKKKS